MSLEAAIQELTKAVEANTKALTGGKAPAKSTSAKSTSAKSTTGKSAASKKKDGPTVDDLAEEFGTYMNAGSKEDRSEAKKNVMAIIQHFEVDRITNLDPDNYQEALDLLAQFKDGENPLGDDDDDGSDLM